MVKLDAITQEVLDKISEGFGQSGAFNLRQNGISLCHGDSEHIKIKKKEDKPGIDIFIDGTTIAEKVYIPVVVSVSGNSIKVIEGNMSDAVGHRTLRVNGKYIRGYCLPKYSAKAGSTGSNTTTPPSNGSASKPASAKKATEAARSFNKTLAGTYVVTANVGLHIRNGAGTGKASLAVLPKGTKVANYGYYTLVGNIKWLYVQVTYKGVTYTGFCSSQYLKK